MSRRGKTSDDNESEDQGSVYIKMVGGTAYVFMSNNVVLVDYGASPKEILQESNKVRRQ